MRCEDQARPDWTGVYSAAATRWSLTDNPAILARRRRSGGDQEVRDQYRRLSDKELTADVA